MNCNHNDATLGGQVSLVKVDATLAGDVSSVKADAHMCVAGRPLVKVDDLCCDSTCRWSKLMLYVSRYHVFGRS